MAYYFKAGKHNNFFDPVSKTHIRPGKPVKVKEVPNSSYFRNALRSQWVVKCTEEEWLKAQPDQPKEVKPKPPTDRKAKLLSMTRKEILKDFGWMDPADLKEADKKNKEGMIEYLLKIEPEYEED